MLRNVLLTFLFTIVIGSAHHEHERSVEYHRSHHESERKFGTFTIMRPTPKANKVFIFNGERYYNWSDWSDCLPTECVEVRQRKCLDDTWKKPQMDPLRSTTCPTKYVAEKRSCTNKTQCNKYMGLQMLENISKICGIRPDTTNIEQKIVGGEPATPHSWPWSVRLSLVTPDSKAMPICGATLIAPQWLVTAAHCLVIQNKQIPIGRPVHLADYMRSVFIAHVGDHHLKKKERTQRDYRVAYAIIPSKYQLKVDDAYDIALLKLAKPVETSSAVDYLCLPKEGTTVPAGTACYATGWGSNERPNRMTFESIESILGALGFPFGFGLNLKAKGSSTTLELHEVQVPITDTHECRRYYGDLDTDLQLCAGEKGKDTCPGDSGGGLYCQIPGSKRWFLHGITSFGIRGCGRTPGVYTSVPAHLEWIRDQVAKFKF